ncbi:hypothetical protein [Thalassoporum mexicanum]|nr:hypothetical protein [Pseudanabaena sp. PCC 7367]
MNGTDIVEAAVATNRLPTEFLNAAGFISAVDSQLASLKVGGE